MKNIDVPRPAQIYGEVGAKLLELDERDKAYELFVLAGNFAIGKALEHPAPTKDLLKKEQI